MGSTPSAFSLSSCTSAAVSSAMSCLASYSRAVSGSRERLNRASQRNSRRAFESASSHSRARGLDHNLAVVLPRDRRQLAEHLQLGELGLAVGLRGRARGVGRRPIRGGSGVRSLIVRVSMALEWCAPESGSVVTQGLGGGELVYV